LRNRKVIIVFFIAFCLFLTNHRPLHNSVQAKEDNPLKIEKLFGLSTIPGTFRWSTAIAIAKDGSIFIADSGESQIEVYDANYQFIRNFGSIGSGDGQFIYIQQIRFDQQDNLYVLDSNLCRIQVFTKEGKYLKKWGEKGKETKQIFAPIDFDFLNEKEILIVDSVYHDYENEDFNNSVKVFTIDGTYSRSFFSDPRYIADDDDLYFSYLKVDTKGNVHICVFGKPPIEEIEENVSVIIKFSQQGEYLCHYADFEQYSTYTQVKALNQISIVNNYLFVILSKFVLQFSIPEDIKQPIEYIKTFLDVPKQFQDNSTINEPSALYCTHQQVFISDLYLNRITIFDYEKQVLKVIQSSVFEEGNKYKDKNKDIPKGILSMPEGLTTGPDDNIYVTSILHQTIKAFKPDGSEFKSFGKPYTDKYPGIVRPIDILFDKVGYCYVAITYPPSIGVYTKDLNPLLVIDVNDEIGSSGYPACLSLNSEGDLVVGCYNYGDNHFILIYDVSDMKNKKAVLKETITIPEERLDDYFSFGFSDIVLDEQDNMILSSSFSSYLLWINKAGEIIRTVDVKNMVEGLCIDGDGNIYVTLPSIGSIYKLSPTGQTIWQSDLGWILLYFIAMDSKGMLYVTDPIHNVVLVISDTTAIPPKPSEPKPDKTNASFFFSFDQTILTEEDNVTLHMMVNELDLCSEINATIQYPSWLLQYNTMDVGSILKNTSFRIVNQSVESNEMTVSIKSDKGDIITNSGALLDIQFVARSGGSGLLDFTALELKDPDGNEIKYKEKTGMRFVILSKDKNPPILNISPFPQVVYDPILLIHGETEPEATVIVNQKEVVVDPKGFFDASIELQKGDNTIHITATDKAGNHSEFSQQVVLKEKTIIQLFIGQSLIIVNGKTSPLDSAPYLDKNSGRTMVPLRAIAESIGAIVSFEPKTQRIDITKETTSIQLWIGKSKAVINGVTVDIDPDKPVSPVIIKGRTFLPLRFIGETLGFKVDWDAPTQRITLTYPKD